jgi:hypothetical protein
MGRTIAVVGVVLVHGKGVIIIDESEHFSWYDTLNCFFYEFPRRLMSSYDQQEAVDPSLQNLTVREGNERGGIYDHIIVAVPGFLQEFAETLGLQ